MRQKDLEQKVRQIFEEQDFRVEEAENGFTAVKGETQLALKVFCSEKFEKQRVRELVEEGDQVFVDEELSELREEVENDVSVIKQEEEEPDFDTPSYEVIGDIAVINELSGTSREEAVEGILHHQNVKTVLLKKGGLKGEYRVGEYEVLYGEETETVHTEFGCDYRVDPTKVYFSERFSTERKRVADQVEEGEKVLVMFAGVGPFAILIGKQADPGRVVAVEKNPEAADYLEENIELNDMADKVEAISGDVREVVPDLGEKFDRIMMPLPESADEYLELALNHIEDNGVIHYYRFLENGNWEKIQGEIQRAAKEAGREFEIEERVKCGERGPGVERVCVDIRVNE